MRNTGSDAQVLLRQAARGDEQALGALIGAQRDSVDLTKLPRCSPTLTSNCFAIGSISAVLVDSLLTAGALSRQTLLADGA
jgi:hypothetical protein